MRGDIIRSSGCLPRWYEVIALRRVKMGDLPLDETLGPGGCRKITAEELQKIIQAVNG